MAVFSELVLPEDLFKALQDVQQMVLGPKELRTPGRSVLNNDGKWAGGTFWERYHGLVGVKGTRCYTLGPSCQRSRNLVSPTAAAKVMETDLDEHQKLRRDMIEVSTIHSSGQCHPADLSSQTSAKAGMIALARFAPKPFMNLLDTIAELSNLHHIGTCENVAFATMQENFATAVPYDKSESAYFILHPPHNA